MCDVLGAGGAAAGDGVAGGGVWAVLGSAWWVAGC